VAVWHAVALLLLQSFPESQLRLTVLAWVPTFAVLAIAGCAAGRGGRRRRQPPIIRTSACPRAWRPTRPRTSSRHPAGLMRRTAMVARISATSKLMTLLSIVDLV
jgi:hypothetical protein